MNKGIKVYAISIHLKIPSILQGLGQVRLLSLLLFLFHAFLAFSEIYFETEYLKYQTNDQMDQIPMEYQEPLHMESQSHLVW